MGVQENGILWEGFCFAEDFLVAFGSMNVDEFFVLKVDA